MYAVEFQAPIKNGIVHIPSNYQNIYNIKEARVFIIPVERQKKQTSFEPKEFFGVANASKNEIDIYLQAGKEEWETYLDEK